MKVERFKTALNEKWGPWIPAMSFVFSSVTNMALFYLGFAFSENLVRSSMFIICNVLFFLSCMAFLVFTVRQHGLSKRAIFLLAAVLAFFVAGYGIALLRYGFGTAYYWTFLQQFAVFGVASFSAGICTASNHQEASIFKKLDSISILIVCFTNTCFIA